MRKFSSKMDFILESNRTEFPRVFVYIWITCAIMLYKKVNFSVTLNKLKKKSELRLLVLMG